MSYRVIKKIKGNLYLYEQETYRDSGKVKTKSKYLGPLSASPIISSQARKEIHNLLMTEKPSKEIRQKVSDLINNIKVNTTNNGANQPVNSHCSVQSQNVITLTKANVNQVKLKDLYHVFSKNFKRIKSDIQNVSNIVFETGKIQLGKVETKHSFHPLEKSFEANVDCKIKLSKYNISERSLRAVYEFYISNFLRSGFDIRNLPKISLQHGKIGFNKSNHTCIVQLPKKEKGYRSKFKNEYSKCLASISLDILEKQKYEKYEKLSKEFQASVNTTNDGIYNYIKNMRQRNSKFKALAFKIFDNVENLKRLRFRMGEVSFSIHPTQLGLTDFSSSKDWKKNFISVMAEIQKQGFNKLYNTRKVVYSKTMNRLQNAERNYQNKNPIMRRKEAYKLRRERALAQAQFEFLNKLKIIKKYFL